MSETQNPYAAPRADLTAPGGGEGAVTATVVQHLRDTKPWVRFLAVLGFIGTGLMVLGGLFVVALGSAFGGDSLGIPAWMGLVYILIAGLYVLPTLFLNRYASAIEDLMLRAATPALENALAQQKSFWRTVGIMAAVILILYALAIVVGIIAAVAGASLLGK